WDVVYVGYKSAVDWPTAYFWRELAEYFPDAKLILTVRNPEDWYRSARATIFNAMGDTDPQSFGRAVIETKIFGGRACCSIQWPNLRAFLSVPIRTEPFPHSSTTTEFRSRFAK
ncbi:sulfotransferase family protein, partial [Mesorhizobium sp. M7A.F.Ca.CA.001.08.2.1]